MKNQFTRQRTAPLPPVEVFYTPQMFSSFFHCAVISSPYSERLVNSEYMKQALAKVGNPNVLVNLISRRVRQLTSGGGSSRPLIDQPGTLGAADIALLEIIEGKMGFDASPEAEEEAQPVTKKRRGR